MRLRHSRKIRVFAMKNVCLALVVTLVGSLVACSSTQETAGPSSPTPTVTVPPAHSAEPVATQPKEPKPPVEEVEPPPEEQPSAGGRLAFQQCSEESRKIRGCTKEFKPVCGEVDTGVRCIRAPCPMASAQQTFGNACTACMDVKVRGYWPISCEEMAKPTAP